MLSSLFWRARECRRLSGGSVMRWMLLLLSKISTTRFVYIIRLYVCFGHCSVLLFYFLGHWHFWLYFTLYCSWVRFAFLQLYMIFLLDFFSSPVMRIFARFRYFPTMPFSFGAFSFILSRAILLLCFLLRFNEAISFLNFVIFHDWGIVYWILWFWFKAFLLLFLLLLMWQPSCRTSLFSNHGEFLGWFFSSSNGHFCGALIFRLRRILPAATPFLKRFFCSAAPSHVIYAHPSLALMFEQNVSLLLRQYLKLYSVAFP